MQNSLMNAAVACCAAIVGLPLGIGTFDLGKNIIAPERSLELQYVRYNSETGLFEQHLIPRGPDVIRGEWAAAIYRGDRQLCSGGNNAPYIGRPQEFSANEWTGGNCPDLKSGDLAVVSWDYKDSHGNTITISRTFEIETRPSS